MEIINSYLINEKTVGLVEEIIIQRKCFTKVIEGYNTFLVRMSPAEIIEASLRREQTNINIDLDYSELLAKKNPICLNPHLGIFLFPTQSLKKHNSEWFSLMHVKSIRALGMRRTEVCTSFGHVMIIDSKHSTFNNMERRARHFRNFVTNRPNCPITFYLEPKGNKSAKIDPDENTLVLKR